MKPNHRRNYSATSASAKPIDVEKLLADAVSASSESLKAALQEAAELEKKKQQKILLEQYQQIDHLLQSKIEALRDIRKKEKAAKAQLELVAQAKADFQNAKPFDQIHTNLMKEGIYFPY